MLRRSIVSAFVVLAAAGCGRTSAQRTQDDHATSAAEEQASAVGTTTITSAEVEPTPAGSLDSGTDAFRAEQDDYRVRLRDALEVLEHRGRAAHEPADRVRRRAQRRDVLKGDLELVERSTEATWATARAKIEEDLRAASSPQSPSR